MSNDLPEVLRVHGEPGEFYDDTQVHNLLTDQPLDYLTFVRDGLSAIASGSASLELPAKQIFADPGLNSDFRVMPCIIRSHSGVRKTVKLVGTNTAQQIVPGQITVGRTFALHPVENFITHTFDACLLSSARTGICAALAVQLLSQHSHEGQHKKQQVALIGAGRVAYYSARYLIASGFVTTLYLDDINKEQAKALLTELQTLENSASLSLHLGRPTQVVDAVVIATTSTTPIYARDDFPARVVVSLGADSAWQHELDPSLADSSALYVDTLDSVRYGDLHSWIAQNRVVTQDLTDLISLVRSGTNQDDDRPRLFISTGSALFDNLTVGYLLSRTSGDTL